MQTMLATNSLSSCLGFLTVPSRLGNVKRIEVNLAYGSGAAEGSRPLCWHLLVLVSVYFLTLRWLSHGKAEYSWLL